jgi:mannose-6-phosphate isomerase class I
LLHNNTEYPLIKGDSYFIPAGAGDYQILGNTSVIVSKI